MSFTKRIVIEHIIKYSLLFLVVGMLWDDVQEAVNQVGQNGNLEALGVIMGLVALASISGYFSFSYTQVSKGNQRYFGYLTTFSLGIAMLMSLTIVYMVAVAWVPEFAFIWSLTIASLLVGIALFDNLDLMRMGLDVSATRFFESGYKTLNDTNGKLVESAIDFLREGHRLSSANGIIEIGRAHV